jgi:hypothetical protein
MNGREENSNRPINQVQSLIISDLNLYKPNMLTFALPKKGSKIRFVKKQLVE